MNFENILYNPKFEFFSAMLVYSSTNLCEKVVLQSKQGDILKVKHF